MSDLKTVYDILHDMWADNYTGSSKYVKNKPDAPTLTVVHHDDYEYKINIEIFSGEHRVITIEQEIYQARYRALDGRACGARFMDSLVILGERSQQRFFIDVAGNRSWLPDLTQQLNELVETELPLLEAYKDLPPLSNDVVDDF